MSIRTHMRNRHPLLLIVVALLVSISGIAQTKPPAPKIYNPDADAKQEIAAAVKKAAAAKKRVLLVFGANWCPDCRALDARFHEPEIQKVIARNFEVVKVDIGEFKPLNADVAEQYGVPLDRGIPALAVLDSSGKLLNSQQNGEFKSARSMPAEPVLELLKEWGGKK